MAEAKVTEEESDDEEFFGRRYQGADVNIKTINITGVTGGQANNVTAIGIQNVQCHDQVEALREKTLTEISEWTKDSLITSSVKTVIDKIKSKQSWITITGNAGEGKTTLGYMCLKELLAEDYNVFKIDTPEDYFTIDRSKLPKCVTMMNDVLGAFAFDPAAWSRWQPVFNHFLDMKHHRKIVIFIGRKNVLQGSKTSVGKYQRIFADDKSLDLSDWKDGDANERLKLLDFYLDKASITDIPQSSKQTVATGLSPHGFPHCCFLYAEIRKRKPNFEDIELFFSKPLEFLNETTMILVSIPYILIFFKEMLMRNGQIEVDSITDDVKRRDIKKACDEMRGSYVKSEKGKHVFSHPSVQESVALCIGESDPLFAVQNYDVSYILQRVNFMSDDDCKPESEQLNINASDTIIHHFCKRFAPDILEKDFSILRHKIFQRRDVYERLIRENVCKRSTGKKLQALFSKKKRTSIDINEKDTNGDTLLHVACSTGSQDAIEILLELGADVKIFDSNRKTAVHKLFRMNFETDLLGLLMKHDADVNLPDKKGKTPFHVFCHYGPVTTESIHLLLKHGADVNKRTKNNASGKTCTANLTSSSSWLSSFSDSDDPLRVKFTRTFKKATKSIKESVKTEGLTALHYLCTRDDIDIDVMEVLLENGASVNMTNRYGMAALHILLHSNCGEDFVLAATKLLIRYGASLDKADKDGLFPLHHALNMELEPEIEFLELLATKASLNAVTDQITPIHHLYECGNIERVLSLGDDVDLPNASEKKLYEYGCLERALKLGADVDLPDASGKTILHRHCKSGSLDVNFILLLLKYGCDVNKRKIYEHRHPTITKSHDDVPLQEDKYPNRHGKTALHYICHEKNVDTEFLAVLLMNGASVNLQDKHGMTPLHYAFQNLEFRTDDLVLMMDSGADMTMVNNMGQTYIHVLCSSFGCFSKPGTSIDLSILEAMIHRGVDVNRRDNYGNSAMDFLPEDKAAEAIAFFKAHSESDQNHGASRELEGPRHN